MKDERQRWVEAGIELAKDPRATVVCPHCGQGNLEVSDQSLTGAKIERHLRCSICGAYNSILLRPSE